MHARKDAYTQDVYASVISVGVDMPRLAPGSEDIAKKLAEAEERRRTLEGSRIGKVQQHNKAVEMRKSSEDLYVPFYLCA